MKFNNTLRSLFILLAAAIMPLPQAAFATTSIDEISALYGDGATYTITRKGKPIGTHNINFDRDNNQLTVNVVSEIRVTVLKIPVFSFDYQATEIWQNDQLVSVNSEVQENNKNTVVSMESTAEKTTLKTAGGQQTVDRLFFSSNHWNPAVTESSRVFNTLTGKASSVNIELIEQQSEVNGRIASRYRYTGDIKADVWYDQQGKWMKLQFKGEDGSTIAYTIIP